jgi:hypothetical protein
VNVIKEISHTPDEIIRNFLLQAVALNSANGIQDEKA